MSNTYGGESWNKKLARAHVLIQAVSAFRAMSPSIAPRCMVLAGPAASDVRVLSALGVPAENITAVDLDPNGVAAAERLGATGFRGDVIEAARARPRSMDIVVLDFCAQLGPTSVQTFAHAAHAALDASGIAIAAFSYGREIGARAAALSETRQRQRERSRAHGVMAMRASQDPRTTRIAYFIHLLDAEMRARGSRWQAFHYEGDSIDGAVFYGAQKDSGAVTPMVYFSGGLIRTHATPGASFGTNNAPYVFNGSEVGVRSKAVEFRRAGGTSDGVADLFCVDKARVAAWLAVDTMQKRRAS